MQSQNLMSGAAAIFAAGVMMLVASTAQAAMAPSSATSYAKSDIQLAAGGCGYGRHRLLGGGCSIPPYNKEQREYLQDLRPCQPGTHSESFPNPQGYRCVLNR